MRAALSGHEDNRLGCAFDQHSAVQNPQKMFGLAKQNCIRHEIHLSHIYFVGLHTAVTVHLSSNKLLLYAFAGRIC